MNAWQVSTLADPPALAPTRLAKPAVGEAEALVKVAYAALNFSDLLMIRGTYQVKPPLPFVPGQEIAGTVVEAGPRSRLSVGDRVASKVVWGGFAEYAAVRGDMAIALPPEISLAEAATLPVVWPTAWIALFDRARLAAGEWVLVLSAAGGAGVAAVQLAKAAGARVIAATRGAEKLALCRGLGADIVVDYSEATWIETVLKATDRCGVDVVFDPVGGETGDSSVKCLAWGGRLLVVGFASGQVPAIRTNRLLLRNASVLGVYWSHDKDPQVIRQAIEAIFAYRTAGKLRFEIGRQYTFEQLPDALGDLAARRTIAKAILSIDPSQG